MIFTTLNNFKQAVRVFLVIGKDTPGSITRDDHVELLDNIAETVMAKLDKAGGRLEGDLDLDGSDIANVTEISGFNRRVEFETGQIHGVFEFQDELIVAPGFQAGHAVNKGQLDTKANLTSLPFEVITETTTARNLTPADNRKYIRCTNSSPITVTVNPDLASVFPPGSEIVIEQAGTGKVTLDGSYVTLNTPETLSTAKQFATITLKRTSSDQWTVGGYLEAA